MAKVLVGKVSELPEGGMKACPVEGHDEVVIAKINDTIYAMRGLCNH
jgi:nitrite reductase/ring-hydroxylating ferredoxin subunit